MAVCIKTSSSVNTYTAHVWTFTHIMGHISIKKKRIEMVWTYLGRRQVDKEFESWKVDKILSCSNFKEWEPSVYMKVTNGCNYYHWLLLKKQKMHQHFFSWNIDICKGLKTSTQIIQFRLLILKIFHILCFWRLKNVDFCLQNGLYLLKEIQVYIFLNICGQRTSRWRIWAIESRKKYQFTKILRSL